MLSVASCEKGVKRPYIIGYVDNTEPFAFDGTGFDIELLTAVLGSQDVMFELQSVDFSDIPYLLKKKKIDGAMAAITRTYTRTKTMDFSDSYFVTGYSLTVPIDNNTIHNFGDLSGKTLIFQENTSIAEYALSVQEIYGFSVLPLGTINEAFDALIKGRGDALLDETPFVLYRINKKKAPIKIVFETLPTGAYCFAVKVDANSSLIKSFNNGLNYVRDSSDVYDKLVTKYFE